LDVYRALRAERRLTVRVYGWLPLTLDIVRDMHVRGERAASGDAWLRTGLLKAYADGTLGSRTAFMLEPFSDDPSTRGIQRIPQADMDALVLAADRAGLPTLAICRGAQLVNVAFGGSLHAHLPEVDGLVEHGVPGGGEPVEHEVRVAPASRLRRATRAERLRCASAHHQGIDRLGPGLLATAWTSDDLVEGIERGRGWMVGVQWHPELTAGDDPAQQALFDEFARHAAAS
jgi:GMP synthase-like glutamine amidotransferase